MAQATNTITSAAADFQDGLWNTLTWSDPSDFFVLAAHASGVTTGLRFPAAQAGAGSAPGQVRWLGGTLTMQWSAAAAAGTTSVWLVTETVTSEWSTANPPSSRRILDPEVILVGTGTAVGGELGTFDITLDAGGLGSPITQSDNWDGFFNFILTSTATAGLGHTWTEDAAQMQLAWTYETELDTGRSSSRQNVSRMDRCPICGWMTFREDWVWCMYHRRLECTKCADPADEQEFRRILHPESPLVGEDVP